MATLLLPVRSDFKAYSFQLELETVVYTFFFGYNTRRARWYMRIEDVAGVEILNDIPILVNIPLTDQFRLTGLPPGRFIAIDETGQNRNPTAENFGTDIKLFYQESEG